MPFVVNPTTSTMLALKWIYQKDKQRGRKRLNYSDTLLNTSLLYLSETKTKCGLIFFSRLLLIHYLMSSLCYAPDKLQTNYSTLGLIASLMAFLCQL